MACCCNENDTHLAELRERQARMLWVVLAINAVMFAVEFSAGWLAHSTALLADSLDMLGDTLVYALSLFVITLSVRAKAGAAALKGGLMLGFGLLVAAEAVNKALFGGPPLATVMAGVGALALAGNLTCLILLTRHRSDDVNMGSAWICSRNDLIANISVLVSAALVATLNSRWPDVVVGAAIAVLFLRSAVGVLREAARTYREAQTDARGQASQP